MINEKSSRIPLFYRGTLENAGLGEVAYFLKKAKQNLDHAVFALENTDLSESARTISGFGEKVIELNAMIIGMRKAIDASEVKMVEESESKEQEK